MISYFTKIGFLTAVLLSASFISAASVFAGVGGGCVPVYGGGVQCPRPGQILIDKTVRNPSTGFFVDNLGPNDPKYRPQWIIRFQIVVRNPGEQTLSTVTVVDTLPGYVDFMTGPTGSNYDSKTRTVTWTMTNLAGGSSQTFEVKGRIVHVAALPEGRNLICPVSGNLQPVNIVEARANDGQTDRDEAQFCIEKEMIVPQVPKAGPEHWVLSIAGIASALVSGLYLRKKASASLKIEN